MLTPSEVALAVADLAPRIEGGQLQKVWQPDEHTLVLRVRRPGASVFVVLSCDPRAARLAEAGDRPAVVPPEPPGLCAWLRAAAEGRRVVSLRQLAGDRVVELVFPEARLVAELSGRHANVFGLDAEGRIVVAAHTSASTKRDLRPGRPYVAPVTPPLREDAPPRFASAAAIEAAARARLETAGADEDAAARRRLIGGVRARLSRLRAKVAEDVARAARAEELRRFGELLKPIAHSLRRGATEARVQDWYAEGAPEVAVPLDPTLDGPGNAARYFARYRKARAGAERAGERLAEVDAQLAALAAIEASDADAVGVEAALRAARLWRAPPAAKAAGKAAAPRKPYRAYTSRAGEPILVGRGGADNHDLTFHVARGNDTWMHVRDAPGAHVVVPQPARGREPHPETLLDAAALAIHHSDLRGEPGAEVTVTLRKHVRAVAGAAPGRVTVAGGRTLTVPDLAARVERLYADAEPA